MAAWFIDIPIEFVVRAAVNAYRNRGVQEWPQVEGKVKSSDCPLKSAGCPLVRIEYEYQSNGETFLGMHTKAFMTRRAAEAYTQLLPPEKAVKIRVKPGDTSVSVMLDEDQAGLSAAIRHLP